MLIKKQIRTDLLFRGIYEPVSAMQYDANTRAVEVTLTAGSVAWTPPTGTAISVAFKKPDGKKGWYDKLPDDSDACSVSGNVVTAILAPEVLTAAGEVRAAIVFQDADLNQLATFGFSVLVEANPAAGRGISNDYYAYSTMEAVSEAVEAMLDSLEDTKADIGKLIVQVSEAVSRAEQAAGPAIVNQASGEVLAVADSADRLVQGLRLFGKTVQNGTPSPDAPVPLESVGAGGSIGVTVAGKNLFDFGWFNSLSFTLMGGFFRSDCAVLPQGDYIWNGTDYNSTVNNINMRLINASGRSWYLLSVGIVNKSVNISSEEPLYLEINFSAKDFYAASTLVGQLERGSVVSSYEPYTAQTLTVSTPNGLPGIPVSSGGNYTDENGQQWLCDEIDFARGVFIQRVGVYSFTGSEVWTLSTNGHLQCTLSAVKDLKKGVNTGVCEFADYQYLYAGSGMFIFSTEGMTFAYAVIGSALVSSAGLTAENAGAMTSGKKVLYELVTPTETPLSAEELAAYAAIHTNKPNTTVYNDAGAHMELSYAADTKLYIDNKFTELAAAIVSNA